MSRCVTRAWSFAVLSPGTMFEFPFSELVSPEEQLSVARCVAIMASRDANVSASERHFVEELMGKMMLLPEERDQVRKEFAAPSDITTVAARVQNREARIFLFYQASCGALADSRLESQEARALLELAAVFEFDGDAAKSFVQWVADGIELRERGQQLVMEL